MREIPNEKARERRLQSGEREDKEIKEEGDRSQAFKSIRIRNQNSYFNDRHWSHVRNSEGFIGGEGGERTA